MFFNLTNDFSPIERPLSPQLFNFKLAKIYLPAEKSVQSFLADIISTLLKFNFEKSTSKASLNEFFINIFSTTPFVLIKLIERDKL